MNTVALQVVVPHWHTSCTLSVQRTKKMAKLFNVPNILTTLSTEMSTGPLIPDMRSVFPDKDPSNVPCAVLIIEFLGLGY